MIPQTLIDAAKANMDKLSELLYPELTWDRFVGGPDQLVVYGWIYTPDKQRDFVVICQTPEYVWYTTSSAKWSAQIATALYGPDNGHVDCRYVSELLKPDASA